MTTQNHIQYRAEYKYQLAQNYQIHTSIRPDTDIETEFIDLNIEGVLVLRSGYAWDGPSGPVRDKPENMRASLVHDALYQLIRQDKLCLTTHRQAADLLFKTICKEDGVYQFTAHAYYLILRQFGHYFAHPKSRNTIKQAPRKGSRL